MTQRTAPARARAALEQLILLTCVSPAALSAWSGMRAANDDEPLGAPAPAAEDGEVIIYGPIVPAMHAAFVTEFFGPGRVCTSAEVVARLRAITGDVRVRINSPGGDVAEASVIHGALIKRARAGDAVRVTVEGMAASAASLIMIAGREITAYPLARVMIHEARAQAAGDAADMRRAAGVLDAMNEVMRDLYAERMQREADEVAAAMHQETWYSATAARDAGLVDHVLSLPEPEPEPTASLDHASIAALLINTRAARTAALPIEGV